MLKNVKKEIEKVIRSRLQSNYYTIVIKNLNIIFFSFVPSI